MSSIQEKHEEYLPRMSRESVDFVADAGGGNRTHTLLRELDFESSASNHETIENKGFSARPKQPGELGGKIESNSANADGQLQRLAGRWGALPENVKQAILLMAGIG